MEENEAVSGVAVEGPIQIITVNESGDAFELHENKVQYVLGQIPPDLPIAVLSVVGAFRTGKSFLLDLFLRYLRYYDENQSAVPSREDTAWMNSADALEGQINVVEKSAPTHSLVSQVSMTRKQMEEWRVKSLKDTGDVKVVTKATEESTARSGFAWRSGDERTTTGIWFWSRPFIRTLRDGTKTGVILMDTQGLFDNDTGQMLTACIFGLSTLISSYVVYNLKERIQEDHLQHLALFSEYGRKVAEAQHGASESTTTASASEGTKQGSGDGAAGEGAAPFQRMEFLVRDADVEFDYNDHELATRTFKAYLDGIMGKIHNEDLRSVRELIAKCYEELACYKLPHPSLAVRKKDYDGNTRVLTDEFKVLLNYYVFDVFNTHMKPKIVNGHVVTAPQLANFVRGYARLFQEKAVFPEAKVLIEATAEANNLNAVDAAIRHYRCNMDEFFGSYQEDAAVLARSKELTAAANDIYNRIANFGSRSTIERFREELRQELDRTEKEYVQRNKERNPLRNIEVVVFAVAVILSGWIIKFLLDYTCAPFSDFCRRGSQMFAFISSITLLGLIGVILLVGKGAVQRLKAMGSAVVALCSGSDPVSGIARVAAALSGSPSGGGSMASNENEAAMMSEHANDASTVRRLTSGLRQRTSNRIQG